MDLTKESSRPKSSSPQSGFTRTVTSVSGHSLELKPDTLCVHGDNEEGIAAIIEIRNIIHA